MSDARHDSKIHRARGLALVGFATGLALSGCASRAPAPVRLEAYPDQRAASRLPAPPDGRAWTAADLLARAARLNPAVAEAEARHRTAVAAAKASKVSPPIGLTLTAEYARAEPKSWLYGAGLDIPLDRGVRRAERVTVADLGVLRARYDYAEALWSVRAALTRAGIERRFADQEIALAREVEALRQARADRLDQRVAAGEDERGQALAARGELNAAHRRVGEALARRAAADAALAAALGLPASAARDLALAPDSAAATDPDVAAAARVAVLTRRDVLRAVVDYDLAESALRLEIARQRPDIHLGTAS
ncbi:TolC family protein [uncultured Caulobacter sp.]|uniref:TolC family protein n=1 Tax=uncultured Caulobacter sp. TaxID=158749 RepID=UPI00261EBAC7|nr:TolC family protein [uncultured Caulobacter sp.]